MNKTLKISLVTFAIIAGTLLLMAGVGGTGPRYVGRFFGDGTGLSNSVDLVEGPNILITPGPGNRAYTIESTAAGAAGIFTNGIMGYGDEHRTNYVRISPIGVTVNAGPIIADRLVILDGAASNYVAGDTTFLGSLFIAGVESSGTIFTSDVFQGNGISLTNLDGTEIRSGTVADARIASTIARDSEVTTATQNSTNAGNIAFLPADNVFTGTSNHFNGAVEAAGFYGDGSGLTNITATATNLGGGTNIVWATDYGAENDGSPDATAAIQNALIYALTNDFGRKNVRMPAGTYRLDGTLWMPTGVTLEGESRGIYSTIINKNGTGPAIAATTEHVTIKNLGISTDDADPTGMYGIMTGVTNNTYTGAGTIHIENVYVAGPEIGFYIRNTWSSELVYCSAVSCVKGVVLTNTVNSFKIDGGRYAGNTNGIWIDMTTSGQVTVHKTSTEGNKLRGIYAANLRGPLNIEKNYFEVNGGSGNYTGGYDIDVDGGASAVNLRIAGNYFTQTHTNIFVKDVSNAEIVGNRFEGGGGIYTNDTYIVADAGCYNLLVQNNSFPDTGTNYLSDPPSSFVLQTNLVMTGSTISAAGHILQDIGANIPTNAVPVGSATVTNWWLGTIGGIPTLVATNRAVGGWIQKALFP